MSLEQSEKVVIYQGEDKKLTVYLNDEYGHPVSLASASEITALFTNQDGSVLVKKLSLSQITPVNAGGGCIQILIPASDSKNLKLGDDQAIEIRATINAYLTIAQIQNAISVYPSLFPNN